MTQATTEYASIKPREEVVQALDAWVKKYLERYGYDFTTLDDPEACQATRRIGRWAIHPINNQALYAAYVSKTAPAEVVESLYQQLVVAQEAFDLFCQIIAHRFHPEATQITAEIEQDALRYACCL